jgi:hypothetical protein
MDSVVELMLTVARCPLATAEQRSRARTIIYACGDPHQALAAMVGSL